MKMLLRSFAILPAIFCAGCIPVPQHFTDRPGVIGVVVDMETGTPISDAEVSLDRVYYHYENYTNHSFDLITNRIVSTTTSSVGAFEIPPKREWNLSFIISDHPWISYQLAVEHTNYNHYEKGIIWNTLVSGKDAVTNFNMIRLTANSN